jgi:hypothetical protein
MRRVVLLGSPILMAISTVLHPHPPFSRPGMLEFLRPRLPLWMGVHVVQLFLVFLLGVTLWFLTEGLAGRAATVSRIATGLFLVFYAAFDSVVGFGTGLLAQAVAADHGLDPSLAAGVVDRFWLARFEPPIGPLIALADLAWLTAVTAAALALRRRGASWSPVIMLIVAGLFFGMDHPWPPGTIGMVALLIANVLLDRKGLLTSQQRSTGARLDRP